MAGYNPCGFKISKKKVKEIIIELKLDKDDIKSVKRNLKNAQRTLKNGDMQLAKVISLDPLYIACFSDEFNAVNLALNQGAAKGNLVVTTIRVSNLAMEPMCGYCQKAMEGVLLVVSG